MNNDEQFQNLGIEKINISELANFIRNNNND